VNVPVGAAVLLLTRPIVPESHAEMADRRFDATGAITITAGLTTLVYAISKAPDVGWATGRTIGLLALSAALIAAFIVTETRTAQPLMPFGIFRNRSLTASNVVGLMMGAVIFSTFFMLTLYVQQVLGWTSLRTGITFLATAGTVVLWAGVSQALTTRFGARPIMTAGLTIIGLTVLIGYTRFPVNGHYWPDLVPFYLTFALGMAFTFIPVSIAAFTGVAPQQAGLASGLLNTSQQIGGAMGVAVSATIFTSHAKSLAKSGHDQASALTSGFHWAFVALAVFAGFGALAAFVLLRGVNVRAGQEAEPVAEAA
jgi:Na+/melibiose symporter-like transporter